MYSMLHIGKAGGSYTRDILSGFPEMASTVRFLKHNFSIALALQTYPDDPLLFAVRDPLEIFVSGFYSRQRKGRPRYDFEWSPAEAVAFTTFADPNALAEALDSADPDLMAQAESAMQSISHVARCLRHYLVSVDLLDDNAGRIAFIFRQSRLDQDIAVFLDRHGLPPHLPTADEWIRHANPADLDRTLSRRAIANLERWYAEDIRLFQHCEQMADRLQ